MVLGQACDLTPIPVAQFAEVRNPIVEQGRGRPMGHPIILHVGTLLDLNWSKMQVMGIFVVTVLLEELATTPKPAPESC